MNITAAVSRAPDSPFTLESVDLDEPRPDEVLVRVVATGLCHTDLTFKSMIPGAAVLGHEGAGVVEAIGDRVVKIEVGDHVLLSYRSCGHCAQCRAGHPPYILHPEADSRLVVFGAGGVGLAAVMAAKAIGVEAVAVVDPVASRRDKAVELGATQAVDPTRQDVATAVGGATHALDTTALPDVLTAALAILQPRGVLVVVGLGQRRATIDVRDLMLSGKMIRGCTEGDAVPAQFIPELLALHARGRFPMEAVVRRYDSADIKTAVADSRSGAAIKPVLVW